MVKIDLAKCDKCGTCVAVCPKGSLILGSCLTINFDSCIQCKKCISVCPFGALALETPANSQSSLQKAAV